MVFKKCSLVFGIGSLGYAILALLMPVSGLADSEVLHGQSFPEGFEIMNTNYICIQLDDSNLNFCKTDWKKRWAANPSQTAQEYVDEYNRSQKAVKQVISYQKSDVKHEYPFVSLVFPCQVTEEKVDHGVKYTVNKHVAVTLFDDSTIKTHELLPVGVDYSVKANSNSGVIAAEGHKRATFITDAQNMTLSIEKSSDGSLKAISYNTDGYYSNFPIYMEPRGFYHESCTDFSASSGDAVNLAEKLANKINDSLSSHSNDSKIQVSDANGAKPISEDRSERGRPADTTLSGSAR